MLAVRGRDVKTRARPAQSCEGRGRCGGRRGRVVSTHRRRPRQGAGAAGARSALTHASHALLPGVWGHRGTQHPRPGS